MVDILTGSALARVDFLEVLYPEEFSDVHPDGEFLPGPNQSLSLPITHLSHVTHNLEASLIKMDEFFYTFKSRQKVGKDPTRDGSPIGETFRKIGKDRYKWIPKAEPVFPGYISWWGINVQDWYRNTEDNFQAVIKKLRYSIGQRSVFEAEYLKYPPSSRYGNREFIFSLKDLVDSYKQSRSDCKNKEVYFRKAGTLRYRFEVCYVVMVVMLEDLNDHAIREMPSMYGEPIFEHNGCINEDGKLIRDGLPSFNIKRPFSWIRDQRGNVSWESLVFAFYFAKQDEFLKCSKLTGSEQLVDHDSRRCISKQPPEPLTCPNILRYF